MTPIPQVVLKTHQWYDFRFEPNKSFDLTKPYILGHLIIVPKGQGRDKETSLSMTYDDAVDLMALLAQQIRPKEKP